MSIFEIDVSQVEVESADTNPLVVPKAVEFI